MKPIGGPSFIKVKCNLCGKEWTRYRLGSQDWQYRDCPQCEAKKFVDKIFGSKREKD